MTAQAPHRIRKDIFERCKELSWWLLEWRNDDHDCLESRLPVWQADELESREELRGVIEDIAITDEKEIGPSPSCTIVAVEVGKGP